MVLDEQWRNSVVKCAIEYAKYIWIPTNENIFHGYDKDGILVNTPDINYVSEKFSCGWWKAGQENRGMPYNWGGETTIKEFENGLFEGKFAGNVPDMKNNGFSKYTIGLDCSGLVAICWNLPKKLITAELSTISSILESTDEMLPGDILLKPGSHVMLFISFIDEDKSHVQIIDATRSTGKVSMRTISISEVLSYGYNGYRLNRG